jgi:cob(I)alamin adenosyltransferase
VKQDGKVWAFYGNGQGKSSAALGAALDAASNGSNAVIIQFLKSQFSEEYIKRCEPELKIFRTARHNRSFSELDNEEQKEESGNIRNGMLLARKFLTTDDCGTLVLDEVLGLIKEGIIDCQELIDILLKKSDDQTLIITGTILPDELKEYCDNIISFTREK